jgi:hypothetical protein
MVDAEGRIVLVNREIERLFGYAREELLGRQVDTLVPARFRSHHPGFRTGFARDPKVRSMGAGRDLYGLRKDGTEVPVEIGLTPVATEEGLFVLGAIVDIGARKRAEEERRRLEEQLRQAQKMEALGTLAGGIAHDFNNILGTIVGYADLIRGTVGPGSGVAADIDELLRAAQRGKELITRILLFSRRQTAPRQPLDLGGTVSEAARLLRASIPAGIEIRSRLSASNSRVAADATAVHQIVMNLANNAAYAMPNGGALELAIEPVYVRDSMVRLHPELREGQYVRLTVSDTGMGIEPGVVERVFEPFFTTKPPGQGSGLGLSMVHGIMSDHEGAVILSSEVGKGTQIQCYFPALETEAFAPATPERETPSGHGERVLLVDDERSLASVGERRLTALGYVVTVSTDPAAALEMFRERPGDFDLVMTDYSMPRMNGLDLARAIHQIRPEVPIFLSTGFAEEFAEESLEASGIRQVLNKPLGIQDLAMAIRAVLEPARDDLLPSP